MADDRSAPMASAAFEARKLLRAARSGTLATVADGGQPYASLATHACAPDLSILLLLSDLAEHTRHLRVDPRCSILVCGAATGANPQTTPRVTVTGIAEVADDPMLKARFLAMHPYAAQYAGFGDFHLWRMRPMGALFIAGFAQAMRLRVAELVPDAAAVAEIAQAEAGIVGRCNKIHHDALVAIAGAPGDWRPGDWRPGDWRMVTADVDGTDLVADALVLRVHWSAPVADAAGVRRELVQMTREVRA